jgi:hypothetical protein
MRQSIRLRLGSLSLLALCVLAAFIAWPSRGAAATGNPVQSWDPQTTNVPYLGWAGEELRLEKCFTAPGVTSDNESSIDFSTVKADFLLQDWSGTSQAVSQQPQLEPSTVRVFWSSTLGEVCAQGDFVSLFPGMSRVELDVVDTTGVLGFDTSGPSDPVLKHQFLAGWMTLNDPSLTEMKSSDFIGTAQAEAARELGDPSGDGEFAAGGNSGYLDVKVTGSMPMTGPWADLVGASSVTLPNDWVTLAHALATDTNPADTSPWTTWDTSGDSTGFEGHVTGTPPCSADPAQFAGTPIEPTGPDSYTSVLDNGDDCTGGGPDGPFSRVFGDLSGDGTSVGPFEPLDPSDTLLSDGNLSSQDAPMPAARLDVSIAPNSGSASDTSGVGSLAAADKTKTYSRDFDGSDGVPHNEYAPFYDAYIPATTRPGDASSGVDGASANNFPGFLVNGEYHFWDIARTLGSNSATATACLERAAGHDPQADSPLANPGDYYQTPSGASSVAVYTDQNGEAQVQYEPGTGFYFDSLINKGGAVLNADGGCDLQTLFNVPDSLGTSSITATARYPFKSVDFPAETSGAVTKSVTSLWSKTLAYFPKGPGAANGNSRIVVAHAQNIDGSPFAGEVVCFSSDAEGMTWFDGTVDGINLNGTSPASDPKGPSLGRTCVTTDGNGNAAVEVLESNPISVNVIADFTDEGILRSITVDYATAGSTGGTPPPPTTGSGSTSAAPATTTTTTTTTAGTTAPSTTVLKSVGLSLGNGPAVKRIKAQITLLRLVSPAHGQHYVLIRVKSSSTSAKVRLSLTSAVGHSAGKGHRHVRTRTSTRTIKLRTNRLVKVTVAGSVLKLGRASLLG